MFVLAHLSDPHNAPLPKPRLAELAGKRALGYVNWRRRRQLIHRPEVLDALVQDLKAQAPDHVAVTGDLVNISLATEFAPAAVWLAALGSPHDVTVVPGNHDAYVRAALGQPGMHWDAYMRGDDPSRVPRFPFVRRRGPVALIGLSSAVASPPLMATGKVGKEQLARLAELLDELGRERAFRIVLVHHPVIKLTGRAKRLVDAAALARTLTQHGAELVLHGHAHLHAVRWLDGLPVVGVPSASAEPGRDHDPAGYNLYRIEDNRCELISRSLIQGEPGFREIRREMLIRSS
jgi:3',5'-cyclic AMP phosphodiesterase CpdA